MRTTFTAALILFTLALSGVAQAQSQERSRQPVIEVAFVLDTTGSMGGLIEGAKQKIWSIASKIATGKPSPKLRVGLIGYRDRGDTYVTKRFDLTDDLDAIYGHLKAFQAGGGGDTPEHVGQALGEAVSTFSWSPSRRVMKMIFLVGDAPPQTYNDGWNYKEWARKAIAKGVVVNTVRCGNNAAAGQTFQAIAHLADGSFTSIDASGGMVAVSTPYDRKIEALNRKMAETALYGGRARGKAQAKIAEISAMRGEAAASRVKYQLAAAPKRGGTGTLMAAGSAGGAKDLVTEPEALDEMADDELPERLRDLDSKARRAHVKKLARKRRALSKKLKVLTAKRDKFVSQKVAKKDDSFDAEVMKQVKAQGKKFGVRF